MCLAIAVIALSVVGTASSAAAGEVPYAGGQLGCVVTQNPWSLGGDGEPLTPPFGPFNGAAVAAAAPNNNCGNN
jgi:hypothetical protein